MFSFARSGSMSLLKRVSYVQFGRMYSTNIARAGRPGEEVIGPNCDKGVGCLDLKKVLAEKIPPHREMVKKFREKYGKTKVDESTVNKIYGGMRGLICMMWETSVLDPEEGIRFRGYTIPDLMKTLPKMDGGEQPLPEGIFWLLMTGDIPTKEQVDAVSKEWNDRASLPPHINKIICTFPHGLHPMSQFSCCINALQTESVFKKAIEEGIPADKRWECAYEDVMNLIAKIPVIAALIYRTTFHNCNTVAPIDHDKDWAGNLAAMMDVSDNPQFPELLRLYLTLLCDHEGGNVSAHTVHLVSSALSDPYLSYAAGINGLAGPLHGLAAQMVLEFILVMVKEIGEGPSDETVKEYLVKHLKSGHVIPGFGHAVLRKTDPRFISQQQFALKHLPDDPYSKIVQQLFRLVPPILKEGGKVQNPWPNVDCHTGVLFKHFGIEQTEFLTVLFGLSRALGTMASLVWLRAMNAPIERPKSVSTDKLTKMLKGN